MLAAGFAGYAVRQADTGTDSGASAPVSLCADLLAVGLRLTETGTRTGYVYGEDSPEVRDGARQVVGWTGLLHSTGCHAVFSDSPQKAAALARHVDLCVEAAAAALFDDAPCHRPWVLGG